MTKLSKAHLDVLESYDDVELSKAIDRWVINMRKAERNREMLKMSMIDGYSFEAIAEKYGMSARQVSNIVHSAQEKLFKHL
jgi:RNA polymerase sigma factor (sigma-70 family)